MQIPPLEQKALEFAKDCHHGQFRLSAEPFILHPIRVANRVRQLGGSTQQIQAAYLHDVVEDTYATHEMIRTHFGSVVASYVEALTSDEDEIARLNQIYKPPHGKAAYLAHLMSNMNFPTLMVKMSDWEDNLRTLPHQTPQGQQYLKESRSRYHRLTLSQPPWDVISQLHLSIGALLVTN
jgi:GTP pyrophosphokinase